MENHAIFENPEELNFVKAEPLAPAQSNEKPANPSKHYCSICNITYQTLKGIHLHNLKMHDPEAVWCHICHRPFKKKENFEKHNLQFHSANEDLKKPTKSRKPSKWAPRPVVLPVNMAHHAPEPVVEQPPKRTRVEDEFSPPEGLHRMDPSSLTAYAWDLITRTSPFPIGGSNKIMPPSSFLTSTGIQPPMMNYHPALMSSFQAAPRGRDPWADQGTSSSRMAAPEEGCSRSSDLFSKSGFVSKQEEPVQIEQPTSAFEALTDKFSRKNQLSQSTLYNPQMNHYYEESREPMNQPYLSSSGSMTCFYPEQKKHQELQQHQSQQPNPAAEDLDLNIFFSDFIPQQNHEPQMWNTLTNMYPSHGDQYPNWNL